MINRLMKSIREYKKEALLSPLFISFEVLLEILIPFFMAKIIDVGLKNSDLKYTLSLGIILIIAAMFSLLFGVLAGQFAAKASAGFAKNLRKDIYYKIQDFSFHNIDKFSTASLVTRMTTDITNVQNAYQMIIRTLVRAPFMMIFALIMVFTINRELFMVFLIIVPILGAGLFIIILKAHPHFEKVFQIYDKLNKIVQENLSGIRVVKSYVRDEYENKKFDDISQDVYFRFKTAEKIVAWNAPLMQFSVYTSILMIAWLASRLIVSNVMTTGELMSMIVYAIQILSSLMMISMVFVLVIIAESSAKRIVAVFKEESDIVSPSNPLKVVTNGSIEFENVDFSYLDDENKNVLKNINLSIKSGETIGIIGGTGSSKSTLVQLIPRLYDASKGVVKVAGRDVREYDLEVLRNNVAMVLQKNTLFSGSIKENLRWGNENATDEEIIEACKLAQAHDFISNFPNKYDTHIEQGGTNVSGGQKQRLCIARALLKKPKILILDDSTSAVDTKTDALLRKAFSEFIPETTKIIIAQRISSIEDADRIIVMDKGEIVDIGTSQELLQTNDIYREIYNSQVRGGVE
ncbi:ABC transporter ATP-binding protein [uncultured Fusobacterium sp.]|nr:ABC transporter ATP-binding protein [uncultured Fusobacterium sp.]